MPLARKRVPASSRGPYRPQRPRAGYQPQELKRGRDLLLTRKLPHRSQANVDFGRQGAVDWTFACDFN